MGALRMGLGHLLVLLVLGLDATNGSGVEDGERTCTPECVVPGIIAHPCDCDKYVNCGHSGPNILDCPSGQMYNDIIKQCSSSCDFNCNGLRNPGCTTVGPIDPPTTVSPCNPTCPTVGTYAHPCDCDKYVSCGNGGSVTILPCPAGNMFNPDTLQCSSLCNFECNGSRNPGCTMPPIVCKVNKKCRRLRGTCLVKTDTCTGRWVRRGCNGGKNCRCCAPKKSCRPNKKCRRLSGTCLARTDTCTGRWVRGGCNLSKKCRCCAPKGRPIRCPTYKRCRRNGGKCKPINSQCEGRMMNHMCTGKRCGCCIPN